MLKAIYAAACATVFSLVVSIAWAQGTEDDSGNSSRAFLLDSPWPVPTSDTWRSSSTRSGGLPANVRNKALRSRSVELGPVPFFGIIAHDALFVLGGSPFLLPLFTAAQANALPDLPDLPPAELLEFLLELDENRSDTPYVAKIDPKTMTVRYLDLPRGPTPNYPGGIVAHQNGFLYVVATSVLYEIDPRRLAVRRWLPLPANVINPNSPVNSTVYNTLQISSRNGDLLLKTGSFGTGEGILVRVDIASFTIAARTDALIGSARSTAALQDETEFVYLPGPTETLRFFADDDDFVPDADWSKTYRSDGDGTTPGVGMVYMGTANTVVFPNNNTVLIGVTEPLSLGLQSTIDDEALPRSVNATGTSAPGGSFTMLAGNPVLDGIIVAQDSVNGRLAAWRIGEEGSFDLLWVTDRYRVSIGSAVVVDSERLYVDDRVCANEEEQRNCRLFLVMLDLETGKEIARTRVAGTEPSLSHIVVGDKEVYYIASEARGKNGFVTRITNKGKWWH